jgi:hypothetical protein
MALVKLWTDSYAPGMVQIQAVNDRITKKIIDRANQNGAQLKEQSALVDFADLEVVLPHRKYKDLMEGWGITIRMDAWELAHYYGYDAHTAFENSNIGKRG